MKPTTLEKQDHRIARPRHVLAPLIHHELELAETAGRPHRVKAGELLLEAKETFKKNGAEFDAWVKRNFHVQPYQGRQWMKWATNESNGVRFKKSPLTRRNTASWYPPVSEEMRGTDFGRIIENSRLRDKEAELEKELALKLINIGYKALAMKLHPDKGGSTAAMNRLNNVRDTLKAIYE